MGIPKILSPALKHRNKRDPHGPPENGTAKVHGSKNCGNSTYGCSDKNFVAGGG